MSWVAHEQISRTCAHAVSDTMSPDLADLTGACGFHRRAAYHQKTLSSLNGMEGMEGQAMYC